ncbi:MAG: tRNA (adenosine(37)-N6)-dimethylallyltransferase MiaA [Eubacteriales bacterium]|nr:tRNA (adenosine(37)-N6)-dimethylallyltransferase MiaA [Eubacteriales bacterium]
MNKLIAVVGTNASGKSGLGVELASRYGGEIISADSRQVYRGLDLGSGKMTPAEMRGVPHHLLDVCEPGVFFSMADFQRLAYAAIDDVLARGKQPFLVGGTGLYVAAVTEGYVLSEVQPDLAYRRELEKLDTAELYARLSAVLPATDIDPRNRNRVMRQLEKLHDGDAGPSASAARYACLKLGVTWDRETLCRRIDERLERRVRDGMLDEVKALMDQGVSLDFLRRLGLEYRYIAAYWNGDIPDRGEMLRELALAIKRFAKRQMTWFRRDSSILWLDMTADPLAQASAAIDAFLGGAEDAGDDGDEGDEGDDGRRLL